MLNWKRGTRLWKIQAENGDLWLGLQSVIKEEHYGGLNIEPAQVQRALRKSLSSGGLTV